MGKVNIPNRRLVKQRTVVFQADGTVIDISAFVKKIDIEEGDISGLGKSGADGVVKTGSITLINDHNENLNPEKFYGEYIAKSVEISGNDTAVYATTDNVVADSMTVYEIDIDGVDTISVRFSDGNIIFSEIVPTGDTVIILYTYYLDTTKNAYNWNVGLTVEEPLLDENKNIKIYAITEEIKTTNQSIISDGTNRYPVKQMTPIPGTVGVVGVEESVYTWDTTPVWDSWSEWATDGTWFSGSVYYDTVTEEFVFSSTPPAGVVINLIYSYFEDDLDLIFSGYLGDRISINDLEKEINIDFRDKSKLLQDYYIEDLGTTVPTYTTGVEYAVETVIQDILTATTGTTLKVPAATTVGLKDVTDEQFYNKSVWDCINDLANLGGLWIGYKYWELTDNFELVIEIIPRTKSTADFEITEATDFYTQTLDITGQHIRNALRVDYINESGGSAAVTAVDAASIIAYGERIARITEDNTTGLHLTADVQAMADNILADLKNKIVESNIVLPFLYKQNSTRIELFNAVKITNSYLFEQAATFNFFAIESIKHSLDFETQNFTTTWLGNKTKVRGGKHRWLNKEARPGAYRQITSRDIGELSQLSQPIDLSVSLIGSKNYEIISEQQIISIASTFTWTGAVGQSPNNYQFEIKKSGEIWGKATIYTPQSASIKTKVEEGTDYVVRVVAVSKAGVLGIYSSEASFTVPTIENSSKMYTIRTQAQFDEFLDLVEVASGFYVPSFSVLRIYEKGSDYEWGTSGTPSTQKIKIEADYFLIEGIGNPSIIHYSSSYIEMQLKLNGGGINGIKYDYNTSYTSPVPIIIEDKTGTAGIIEVSNNEFTTTNSYDAAAYTMLIYTENDTKLMIRNNEIYDYGHFIAVTEYGEDKDKGFVSIYNNDFYNGKGYPFIVVSFAKDSGTPIIFKNLKINSNNIFQAQLAYIYFRSHMDGTECSNITMNSNYIGITSDMTNKKIIEFVEANSYTTTFDEFYVTRNIVDYGVAAGAGGYDLINDDNIYISFEYSIIGENIAKGKTTGFLSNFVSNGTGPGIKEVNNTKN